MQTFVLAREKEAWLCGRLIKRQNTETKFKSYDDDDNVYDDDDDDEDKDADGDDRKNDN